MIQNASCFIENIVDFCFHPLCVWHAANLSKLSFSGYPFIRYDSFLHYQSPPEPVRVVATVPKYQSPPKPVRVAATVPLLAPVDAQQRQQIPKPTQILDASERFSFEMTYAISEAIQKYDVNFVISPFSIWSLMVLIAEGASAESLDQLRNALHLPNDLSDVRTCYKDLKRVLLMSTSTSELTVNQALFSNIDHPIDPRYAGLLTHEYEVDLLPVDFRASNDAAKTINSYIDSRTHGKIKHIINPADITDIQLLLSSSIFFRGQWKFPFDVNHTIERAFYREDGEYIAHVPMMMQENQLRYVTIPALEASFIELPYNTQNRHSMLLVYPNSTLTAVFRNLRKFDIARIHQLIKKNNEDDDLDDVKLTLPKFKIDADLELSTVFKALGVNDIFDPARANLSKMSRQKLHLSHVFHKAIIEVDEIGTVAAAVTTAPLSNRNIPREFVFNRPFCFLITDQLTNTLLFAGQVRYPMT